jgi:flagellar M-ring protein FliF
MSELIPAETLPAARTASVLSPLTDPAGGNALGRLKGFAAQPAIRKMLPLFLGLSALGGVALTWSVLSPSPQRVLYAQLGDSERAGVVDALDKAAIPYKIDNQTGSLTVGEGDFYRARMLVASNGSLAAPESGDQMLDNLPMGASRTLEGERLRSARERDLQMTIQEIDGVESVRVHLAEAEQSVFVRDNLPPTASVMVRLVNGRQLSESQTSAIVNLVAGSVPGLAPESVRIVDQHGRLLSDKTRGGDNDRLELQQRMEDKLRTQVSQLLTPMLGDGNFTSEIQIELNMDQVTSARESYDKDGSVRSETQQQSQSASGPTAAVGVPGALSNSPPPTATASPGPPQGTQPAVAASAPAAPNTETNSVRTYELGREVSVANSAPGAIKRLSVAVAISAKAMKGGKPADMEQMKALVTAAVGANTQRGDQVTVMARNFEPMTDEAAPFYEAPWFATVVRSVVALLAVLLVLMLGVRPLIKALRRDPQPEGEGQVTALPGLGPVTDGAEPVIGGGQTLAGPIDSALLSQHVGLAQRLVAEKPDSAVVALRQMLNAEPKQEAPAQ